MTKRIKNYFAGANTCKGFYSLYDSALEGLDRIFIIKGGPGTGKSTLMRSIGLELVDRGYDVEFLRCSSDDNSLDGMIVRSLSVGIVDGTAPHVIEPKNPGIVEEIVNLGECWNRNQLLKHKDKITEISKLIKEQFAKAYSFFTEAKLVHDELESLFISNMDFKKSDEITRQLINELFESYSPPYIKHMFFAANTPAGLVEYIDNLTIDVEKRYIIKGKPGTGKSTLMKKIAKAAQERGFDMEIYYCEFDPESIDMLIIPKLKVAILDGTHPHEINATRERDVIIDLQLNLDIDTIKGLDKQIVEHEEQFKEVMTKGISHISKANQLHRDIEKYYIEAMDFEKVNHKKLDILKEIIAIEQSVKSS